MSNKGNSQAENQKSGDFAFAKINFIILSIGVIVLIIGFLLMIGGASDDPNVFNPEVFSQRRITVAPIVILIGFAAVLYGIMKKPVK